MGDVCCMVSHSFKILCSDDQVDGLLCLFPTALYQFNKSTSSLPKEFVNLIVVGFCALCLLQVPGHEGGDSGEEHLLHFLSHIQKSYLHKQGWSGEIFLHLIEVQCVVTNT